MIELDIDHHRLHDILEETYRICQDVLMVDFFVSQEDFIKSIDKYVECNRVSVPVRLPLPSKRYPELEIEVDPRKKSVISRMAERKLRIHLNRFLGVL
jgi:hypothetical protein